VLDERRQFRVLFRVFLSRAVELDLLSPGGNVENLAIQFVALLLAFNFVVAYVMTPRYFTSPLPSAILRVNAWSDEEFLVSTTSSVVGMFLILAWDTLLPDIRDALVLTVLPVRARTIAFSKITAIACAVGIVVVCVNFFTSFCYAGIVGGDAGTFGVVRAFVSYWMTMAFAAVFMVAVLVGVPGVTAQFLSYRSFLRVSGVLELMAFFAILGVYFLKPQLATVAALHAPQNASWLNLLPSYWFLGLFERLNGSGDPVLVRLGSRAIEAMICALLAGGTVLALVYLRTVKKIIEAPDISRAAHLPLGSRILIALATRIFRRPIDRAILLFISRTLARSHRHRLLLAIYGGIGLAVALAYAESLVRGEWEQKWYQPNALLLVASFVILFFVVPGMRIVFTFPHALRSNWIFRVTAVQHPSRYFFAVRKALYCLAVFPILAISGMLLFALWPTRPVLLHMGVFLLVAILAAEKLLHGFRKIPFTCSYLPGKANLNFKLGAYAAVILFAAHWGGFLEFWAIEKPSRYVALVAILLTLAVWARFRFHEFATAPQTPIQFEERPPADVYALDLRLDGELLGGDVYVEPKSRGGLRWGTPGR
jgi:hypothetical protein